MIVNTDIEFAPVYSNSATKSVMNQRIRLESFFQEILYMIDVWTNNGSGWNLKLIESQQINISTYRPLSGSFDANFSVELRSSKKRVINIKNKAQKYFLWCQARHINPSKNISRELKK